MNWVHKSVHVCHCLRTDSQFEYAKQIQEKFICLIENVKEMFAE